jgi:hypothetical protein
MHYNMKSTPFSFPLTMGFGWLDEASVTYTAGEWQADYVYQNKLMHRVAVGDGYAVCNDASGVYTEKDFEALTRRRFFSVALPEDPAYHFWRKSLEGMDQLHWPITVQKKKVGYRDVGHIWLLRVPLPPMGWPIFQHVLGQYNFEPFRYRHYQAAIFYKEGDAADWRKRSTFLFELRNTAPMIAAVAADLVNGKLLPPSHLYPVSVSLFSDVFAYPDDTQTIYRETTGEQFKIRYFKPPCWYKDKPPIYSIF